MRLHVDLATAEAAHLADVDRLSPRPSQRARRASIGGTTRSGRGQVPPGVNGEESAQHDRAEERDRRLDASLRQHPHLARKGRIVRRQRQHRHAHQEEVHEHRRDQDVHAEEEVARQVAAEDAQRCDRRRSARWRRAAFAISGAPSRRARGKIPSSAHANISRETARSMAGRSFVSDTRRAADDGDRPCGREQIPEQARSRDVPRQATRRPRTATAPRGRRPP